MVKIENHRLSKLMVQPIFSDIKVRITKENTTMLVIESSNLGLRATYGVPVDRTSAFEEMIAEAN